MTSKVPRLVALFLLLVSGYCVEICGSNAAAQPSRSTSQADSKDLLHTDYFRLKNTDPLVENLSAWEGVVERYRTFAQKPENLSDKFLFDHGCLLEEFGRKQRSSSILSEAKSALDILVERFPKSSLADDALYKKAQILNAEGAAPEEVKRVYDRLLSDFSQSDMAELARARFKKENSFSSPAREVVDGAPAASEVSRHNLPVVVLDPGHGGDDFGAENELGLLEKDVVLSIALDAERMIQRKGFAKVVLTRRNDVFVPLLDRVGVANKNGAALFVSIHNNASPKKNQTGLVTYVLDESSDEASRLLAERENKSSANSSGQESDLSFILSDLVQTSKHPKSLLLAQVMNRAVLSSLLPVWPAARSNGIKRAPFYVLVGAHMPCVLLELFFLDHELEGERLSDPEIRHRLAEGLVTGIEIFLAKSNV